MQVFNDNNLVSLSNSLLKHYKADTFHPTLKEIDEVLKGHKKIVLCLFDGMGRNIVRKHLKKDSFIRQHYFTTINSVFPPTTVAATNALLSGRYPIETGWLAWSQYFFEYQRNIVLFRNKDYNTNEIVKDNKDNIAQEYYHYESILELIKKASPNTEVLDMKKYPISPLGVKTLNQGKRRLNKYLRHSDDIFIYFYMDVPDYLMHEYGIDHHKVHKAMQKIDKFMKKVATKNQDTLFIVIADHGHINVTHMDICDHDDLYQCLRLPMSFEKRTATFFVKEDKKEEFKTLFNKYYGQYFELLTKEEALRIKLYGEGEHHPHILASIGDYLAISKSEYAIYAGKEMTNMTIHKGHHAGGTEDERLIDLSIYNK